MAVDVEVGDVWRLKHRPHVRLEVVRLEWGGGRVPRAYCRYPGRPEDIRGYLPLAALERKWERESRAIGGG